MKHVVQIKTKLFNPEYAIMAKHPLSNRCYQGIEYEKEYLVEVVRLQLSEIETFLGLLIRTARDIINKNPVHENPKNYYGYIPSVLNQVLQFGNLVGYTDDFKEAFIDLASRAYKEDWDTVGYYDLGTYDAIVDPYTWDWENVSFPFNPVKFLQTSNELLKG